MDTTAEDTPLTLADRKKGALAAFTEYGTVASACRATGVGQTTWYRWKREDSKFAAALEAAKERVADELEEEAIRRAKDGSYLMPIFVLKSLRPERYWDKFTGEALTHNSTLGAVFKRPVRPEPEAPTIAE